jgi:glycosyltransferase involved in cell wall biosynthesis
MMRVALLTDGIYPYVVGGMQKYAYLLAKYIAQSERAMLDIYQPFSDKHDVSRLEHFTDEQRRYITTYVTQFPANRRYPGHYARESYIFSKRIFEKLKDRINDYDFIIAQGFTGWYLLNQKRNIKNAWPPVIVHFHGYEMFQSRRIKDQLNTFFLRAPVIQNMRKADFVISLGGKITNIIKRLGIDEKKILELSIGVDDDLVRKDLFTEKERPRTFVFIGRSERRKGIIELNRALSGLKGNFNFHFIGPIQKELQVADDRISYHGQLTDAEKMTDILLRSDILVCPSLAEGMPNVILEGMANGLAIIATDVGAVSLLVDEENGWLIPPQDISALRATLSEAMSIEEEVLTDKKRKSLKKVSESYRWSDLANLTLDTIKSATAQRP